MRVFLSINAYKYMECLQPNLNALDIFGPDAGSRQKEAGKPASEFIKEI
jgi:hypothetical protein